MELIDPKVEFWSEIDLAPSQQIARCARVCYGGEGKLHSGEEDDKLYDGLIKRGHVSMLRHSSIYGSYTCDRVPDCMRSEFVDSIVWGDESDYYFSTNGQFAFEKQVREKFSPAEILNFCKSDPSLFDIYRMTFCITTQISTSREMNRVSPNNIAERSTRYCASKYGLEICKPWYWDEDIETEKRELYLAAMQGSEGIYLQLLAAGVKPEDARGVLPLDTATKVVYTYSVRRWKHIINLRYYGTTGRPHPNAKLVIGQVRDYINQFAMACGIDYQL